MTAFDSLTTHITDAEVAHLASTYAAMHLSILDRDARLAGWYWELTSALADELARRGMQAHALVIAAGEVGCLADDDDEDLSGWIVDDLGGLE